MSYRRFSLDGERALIIADVPAIKIQPAINASTPGKLPGESNVFLPFRIS
jgi:hypothetical protein